MFSTQYSLNRVEQVIICMGSLCKPIGIGLSWLHMYIHATHLLHMFASHLQVYISSPFRLRVLDLISCHFLCFSPITKSQQYTLVLFHFSVCFLFFSQNLICFPFWCFLLTTGFHLNVYVNEKQIYLEVDIFHHNFKNIAPSWTSLENCLMKFSLTIPFISKATRE